MAWYLTLPLAAAIGVIVTGACVLIALMWINLVSHVRETLADAEAYEALEDFERKAIDEARKKRAQRTIHRM